MSERRSSYRPRPIRTLLTRVIAPVLVIATAGYGYEWREVNDQVDNELSQARDAFVSLSQAPPTQQASNRFELTSQSDLLLNSIGAWVVSKTNTPNQDGGVRLHVTETRDFDVTKISAYADGDIPLSTNIPAGVTDITLVKPVIHGAQCHSDKQMTVQSLDVLYAGHTYSLNNLQLPGQCTNTNGLHGTHVTIHGQDYLSH